TRGIAIKHLREKRRPKNMRLRLCGLILLTLITISIDLERGFRARFGHVRKAFRESLRGFNDRRRGDGVCGVGICDCEVETGQESGRSGAVESGVAGADSWGRPEGSGEGNQVSVQPGRTIEQQAGGWSEA